MTDREAMKMALDALEEIHVGNMTPMAEENWNEALTTLRQALAQPNQTPCKCTDEFWCATFDRCKRNEHP
jgi:hypothetical protein